MYNSIATNLFQNKKCYLPYIGTLKITTVSAKTDFVNSRIAAPTQAIGFLADNDHHDPSINYEFSSLSALMKNDLDKNIDVPILGVGIFSKNETSTHIKFTPHQLDNLFFNSVVAEKVIRQNASHQILVGDKETTSTAMADYFTETVSHKNYWWVSALILMLVSIVAIIFHFLNNGKNIGCNNILEHLFK